MRTAEAIILAQLEAEELTTPERRRYAVGGCEWCGSTQEPTERLVAHDNGPDHRFCSSACAQNFDAMRSRRAGAQGRRPRIIPRGWTPPPPEHVHEAKDEYYTFIGDGQPELPLLPSERERYAETGCHWCGGMGRPTQALPADDPGDVGPNHLFCSHECKTNFDAMRTRHRESRVAGRSVTITPLGPRKRR